MKVENYPVNVTEYDWKKQPTEYTNGKSETVPDQALTPSDIIKRYKQNQPLPVNEEMGFIPQNLSEFDHMDKFDRINAARKLAERINEFKREVSTKEAEAKAEADQKIMDEKLEQLVNERLAKKEQPQA